MAATTKQALLADYMRKGISEGRWVPGERMPDDEHICRQLAVSRSTLGNVMSILASEGLVYRRQCLGTFVADKVSAGVIVVLGNLDVLDAPSGYYFREIVEQVQRRVDATSYTAKLSVGNGNTPEEFAESIHILDELVVRNIAGVISTIDMGPLEARLAERGIPAVSIVSHHPMKGHCVFLDRRALCAKGVGVLRRRGFRRYAVLANLGVTDEENRQATADVQRWLREADPEFDPARLVMVPFSRATEEAYKSFLDLWQRRPRPEAVFFLDDGLFEGAAMAIMQCGIQVPRDLGVLTHSNKGRRFSFPVPLCRIEFDPAEATAAAWKMLLGLLEGGAGDRRLVRVLPHVRNGDSLVTAGSRRRRSGGATHGKKQGKEGEV